MKLYADTPLRRTAQLTADILFILWMVIWVWIGNVVHDGTMALSKPGELLDTAASSLAESLSDAGQKAGDVPVVGDPLSEPFDKAASASDGIAKSGRASVAAVERLAFWLGTSVAMIPILTLGAIVVPLRWRFVRQATAGQRFIDAAEDLDLFALRALARQPMHLLAQISEDPAGGWRTSDPRVVMALAELELKSVGLRLPARLTS
jgi:hypothetical protein